MNHRRWRSILLLLAILLPAAAAAGPAHEPYILARISIEAPGDVERLGRLAVDIVRVEPERWAEAVTHERQVRDLRERGFEVEVLVADMEAEYARAHKGSNFGSYHTYSETIAELDALHAAYPQITTGKVSLGTSHEGRDIWAIKVSDNPELQEDEPEVLFDGLHHAREVITVEVVLNTLNHLCQNYGTDPDVTFLVDHRQIWFVPIINPDGFVYNETNWPAGGGMWRKNRRDNGDGSYGVDPNRNYPYQWGGIGSSGDPSDETYRGPYPGSEPEVQALMGFIEAHQFVTHQSYHSYAELILLPWAYTSAHTVDDSLFRVIGNEMARDSDYDVGQSGELLYYCSGVTTDWAYGDTSEKPKILSFTTEVGGSDFWPSDNELDPLVRENLHSDLFLIQTAGSFPVLEQWTVRDSAGNDRVDPGELAILTVTVNNGSPLVTAGDITVALRTDEADVELIDDTSSLGDIATDASAPIPSPFVCRRAAHNGAAFFSPWRSPRMGARCTGSTPCRFAWGSRP
jgi:carboxypeptidase T